MERQLELTTSRARVRSFILSQGERGNNFQHVLEGGGICPPTRRRALNGFLVGAVKRIKTRTDDEGGGPSLPKIRLCIKTPPGKFAAQWYLTHLTRLMKKNHELSRRINCFSENRIFIRRNICILRSCQYAFSSCTRQCQICTSRYILMNYTYEHFEWLNQECKRICYGVFLKYNIL